MKKLTELETKQKENRKKVRELNAEATRLSSIIWCSWNSASEEKMIEVVKQLAAISKEIDKITWD
jgi:uncharacterized coiled-coil DUF342 family protein